MASGLLPKSPVSSSLCDEVPHIFIPKSHLEPREFLISSAKRLLQQYLPIATVSQVSILDLCAYQRKTASRRPLRNTIGCFDQAAASNATSLGEYGYSRSARVSGPAQTLRSPWGCQILRIIPSPPHYIL